MAWYSCLDRYILYLRENCLEIEGVQLAVSSTPSETQGYLRDGDNLSDTDRYTTREVDVRFT